MLNRNHSRSPSLKSKLKNGDASVPTPIENLYTGFEKQHPTIPFSQLLKMGGTAGATAAIGRTGGEPRTALAVVAPAVPPSAWKGLGAGAGLLARTGGRFLCGAVAKLPAAAEAHLRARFTP